MRLKTAQIKGFREALLAEQNGRSAISGQLILPGEAVLDHDHLTGRIRGVITRAENSVLGKVENGRRFGKSFDPIAFARGLLKYITKDHGDVIHPTHLTLAERQAKAKAKAQRTRKRNAKV